MSSTQNSNVQQQSYENFEPPMEKQENADAHVLLIRPPDFTRQEVGANYEAAFRTVRVFGEKPIENNKRKRFSVRYIIPEDCDADKLKGQFQEGAIITITMPKKPKKPEPAQEQEEAKQQVSAREEVEPEAEMKNGEKDVSEDQKPKSEMESERESDEEKDETPTPPEPEPTDKESKMPQKHDGDEKMRESTEDSSSITEKEQGSESGIPQKDQEEGKGIPQEDEKKTSEEGTASPQKDQCLEREKSNEFQGKETAVDIVDESPGLKTPEKREKEEFQRDHCLEREKSKEERKESAMVTAAESSDIGLKKTPEKKEEKQMISESSSSIDKGIKDMANSASQAVTRLVNRFSEEDIQKKLLCAGAAILVVVVGIYASSKLRP